MNSKDDGQDSNAQADKLIDEIAQCWIDNIGWTEVLEALPTLEGAGMRLTYHRPFVGTEWIGAHLLSVLRDKVEEQALSEGRYPNDGRELERREEKATRGYPGAEWLECPLCHDEFNKK